MCPTRFEQADLVRGEGRAGPSEASRRWKGRKPAGRVGEEHLWGSGMAQGQVTPSHCPERL